MNYLIWLPSAIILGIVAIGYILHRQRVSEVFRGLETGKVFTSDEVLAHRPSVPMLHIPPGKGIGHSSIREGVQELTSYVSQLKPDWIVGVHLGGRLLSTFVADKMEFPPRNCLFLRRSDDKSTMVFETQIEHNSPLPDGTVLVVDDISRSGRTLATVRAFFSKMIYSDTYYRDHYLDRIYFGILLEVAEGVSAYHTRFRPDWSWRQTDNIRAKLPWSELNAKLNYARELRRDNFTLDADAKELLNEYQRICTRYTYALQIAKRYLE